MLKRTLWEICKLLQVNISETHFQSIRVEGVSTDTRTLVKGNLFVPIIGENFNGHLFVNAAIEKGAAATIWKKDEPNPPTDIPVVFVDDTLHALQQLAKGYLNELSTKVVAITGSNGKTTTKDLVGSVLSTTYKVQKTEGNFNNHIGLPLTILQLEEDTEIAVLEMGMSGRGEIELLSNIAKPDVAIITNIGEAHLQDLGSRKAIAEAKLEITSGLKKDGILFIDGDEPLLTEKVKTSPFQVKTFGITDNNDFFPKNITQRKNGTSFIVNDRDDKFFIPVLGKHNVTNSLAAIGVGLHFNVSIPNIQRGLKNVQLTGMRMELKKGINGVTVINDAYNASPTSMKAALQLLADLTGYRKKIVVLGDMLELGEQEEQFHREIGLSLYPDIIDYVFTYGKLSEKIAEGAKDNYSTEAVFSFHDKDALVEKLLSVVEKGDVVLVKGSRGMKLEEVVEKLI